LAYRRANRAERFPVAKATPGDTGRQVWNRQRTDRDLVDAGDIVLGHEPVQRWNLPDGWVISHKPAHPPLVSETDFIAAQDINAARRPAPGIGLTAPQKRCYFLAGLLICGGCGRKMESAWSNGKPEWWQSCSRLTPPGYRGSLGVHGCVSAGQTVRLASGSSWPGTVKTHVNSLTRKLRVAVRSEAGAACHWHLLPALTRRG